MRRADEAGGDGFVEVLQTADHIVLVEVADVVGSQFLEDLGGLVQAGAEPAAAFLDPQLGVRLDGLLDRLGREVLHGVERFRGPLGGVLAVVEFVDTPRTNGKVERFNGTLAREWAYVRDYLSERDRQAALADFLNYYNHERPHTALGGRPPVSRTDGSDYRVTFDRPPEPLETFPQQLALDEAVEPTS
ncbi:hypothetical protein CXR04_04795 [Streptomyces sp. CMB-StM0423]|nr:hypothetical protein CXR04_04795 [Streptomyces sp. CMB-StM0423]